MVELILEDAKYPEWSIVVEQHNPNSMARPAYITIKCEDGFYDVGLSYAQLRKLHEAIGTILRSETPQQLVTELTDKERRECWA